MATNKSAPADKASAKKQSVDWEAVELEYQSITNVGLPHGKEVDIVDLFVMTARASAHHEDRIPMSNLDTTVREMAFKFGRADIVVFHVDGSASVIEVKDGTKGYGHVIAGIGQASLYAVQLAMSKRVLNKVRKCLLWTSTGNSMCDAMIEIACEQANVVPLPWGKLGTHLAYREAVSRVAVAGV